MHVCYNFKKCGDNMASKIIVKVTDRFGFHARPASQIMDVVCKYKCDAVIAYNYDEIDLTSFSDIMQMNIPMGAEVEIIARGNREREVIEEIKELVLDLKIGEIV